MFFCRSCRSFLWLIQRKHFIRETITVRLTSSFIYLVSAALLMLNEKRFTCLVKSIDIYISRLIIDPACLPTQPIYFTNCPPPKWCYLPTHKHQADWTEKIVPAWTNPPPPSCFFVVSGYLAPLFIIGGQTMKLKPISCLLN